ncbi:MAG: LysR family transcriptional regulator [Actinomycetes bacterium]|nr:LysR family transcriptional regulator [Actinomycetes bacterium]
MDTDSLRYFVVYCKYGNISRAAEELYMTQQGLSRAIRAMSQEMGVPLTERRGTKSVLTPFGEEFRRYAENRLAEYEMMLARFSEMAKSMEGTVRLGYALGARSFMGFDLLDDFEIEHPEIRVIEEEHEDLVMEKMVLHGELDMGITVHQVDTSLYDSVLLKSGPYYLICHESNPLATKQTIRFADLEDKPIVALTDRCKSNTHLVKHCRENGFEPNIVKKTKEMVTIWELCLDNHGIAVSSAGRLLRNKFDPDRNLPMVEIPFDDSEHYYFNMYLIIKKGKPLSWPAQLLYTHLREHKKITDVEAARLTDPVER